MDELLEAKVMLLPQKYNPNLSLNKRV